MASIRVSIVIPVHNGAKYLREAIDSALAQTYRDTEIIVVNDGSTDNGATEDVARSYGEVIRYLSQNNGGVASALNAGIETMTGDYFSWLSHDDLYEPHKIARQVEMIVELGDPDTVVFSDYVNVDAENRELYPVRMDHDLLARKPLYAVFRGALHGCTLLIPRKALLEVGMFKNLPTTQDYDLWFRLIRRYLFRHIPEILVRSRLHPEQASRTMDATAEAERLWIRMMSELTPEEIATLEDSEREFFAGMVKFLSSTPYRKACAYAKRRAGTLFLLQKRVSELSREILGALGLLPYARTLKHMLRTENPLMAPRFWVHVVFLEMKQRRRDEVLLDAIRRILDKVGPRLRS
jgi:hypothetical protein